MKRVVFYSGTKGHLPSGFSTDIKFEDKPLLHIEVQQAPEVPFGVNQKVLRILEPVIQRTLKSLLSRELSPKVRATWVEKYHQEQKELRRQSIEKQIAELKSELSSLKS